MSRYLEGRVTNFLSDEVYEKLPDDMKEIKNTYQRKFNLVRRKMGRIETLKKQLIEEKEKLVYLKYQLTDYKPKVDYLLQNFKISISMSSYKKKYFDIDYFGGKRENSVYKTERDKVIVKTNYICFIERTKPNLKKSIHLGTEEVLKKFLTKKYENKPIILKQIEDDVMGYVSGVVKRQDFYDRILNMIVENPKGWDSIKLSKKDVFI